MYEDHSVPVATVQVWYHVGSKDEKKGRSGFAHLFEHLMFKGSAHLGPEEHKNFIASIGGRYNATTDFDRTLYFQSFPSNYLERVLWMEADRMSSLDVSDENFKSERDVVKEERRLRVRKPALRPPLRGGARQDLHHPPLPASIPSAAWPTSTPPPSRTCATSTASTTCPTTPRWWSPATSRPTS